MAGLGLVVLAGLGLVVGLGISIPCTQGGHIDPLATPPRAEDARLCELVVAYGVDVADAVP